MKPLSRVQLCNPMDCSLPGSSIHGIFQAKEYWSGLPFPSPGYFRCPQTNQWSLLIQQYTILLESVWHFLYLYKKPCFVLLPALAVIPLTPSGQILSLGCFPAHWPQQICPMFESLLFDRLYPTIKHSKLAVTHYFIEVSCVSPLGSFLELETLSRLFHFTLG